MTKSKLLPSIVLSSICLVVSALLAAVNMLTSEQIELNNARKAEAALVEVLPGHSDFTDVNISDNLPDSIDLIKKSAAGGYVFRAVVTGKSSGLTVMIGIDTEGKITGTKCIANKETASYAARVFEKTESGYFVGMTESSYLPCIISGATLTSEAYSSAVEDALLAFSAITGGNE